MDPTPYLEPKIAPRAVCDRLPERRARARFMVPAAGGDWRAVTWGAFAGQIRQAALFLAAEGLAAGDRVAVFAPNRVEWLAAALGAQAAGGVMVPIYPASTAEQAAYVVGHSDARVLFVDGAPLLARVLAAWDACAGVERIVLLDDALDPARALADLRAQGKEAPSGAEVAAKVVPWSRALAAGAARDADRPGAFERALAGVDLDQPGLMLYTSGTSGNRHRRPQA